jgi:transposase
MEKTKEIEQYLMFQKKLRAVEFAKNLGCRYACQAFNVGKTSMYNWMKKYEEFGEEGLLRKKRAHRTYWNSTDQKIVELILKLREEHQLGTWRIKWYLERYHDINVSESTVYRTLKRHNLKPLNREITRRSMGPKRYAKSTPGHHVQVDPYEYTWHPFH